VTGERRPAGRPTLGGRAGAGKVGHPPPGANQHKTHLLPQADQSLSALIEDLDVRGLLDSTLVVAMGEFGRTPRINRDGGRDHWPDCYTVVLAGGGVTGGAAYGASDRIGAYPAADPVTPGDLAATIYWRFGLDPVAEIHDQAGRPHRLAPGAAVRPPGGRVLIQGGWHHVPPGCHHPERPDVV
jgi:hypothetical protein